MWTESHGNLARHPKTRRLMQRMGWTLPHTIGNLHLLWWWALEYAPTGDLTKFDSDQLTYDLDLGTATPEQFLEAMVEVGFIDRLSSGSAESRSGGRTLRLHDWPDYTTKSLRPKYRRNPEKWHNVLRSYGRPIYTRHTTRRPSPHELRSSAAGGVVGVAAAPSGSASTVEHGTQEALRVDRDQDTLAPERAGSSSAEREPKSVGLALRAGRRISSHDAFPVDEGTESQVTANIQSSHEFSVNTVGNVPAEAAPIPKSLSGRRNFNGWWLKLQECYQNKGCPLTSYEQGQLLAMLDRNPFSAVEKLQYSVVNFEASYATLLAPRKPKTSVEHGPTGGAG